MEYNRYITRKRAKFDAICGHVNIPYGTALINQGGFLMWNGKQICGNTFCLKRAGHGYSCGYH